MAAAQVHPQVAVHVEQLMVLLVLLVVLLLLLLLWLRSLWSCLCHCIRNDLLLGLNLLQLLHESRCL